MKSVWPDCHFGTVFRDGCSCKYIFTLFCHIGMRESLCMHTILVWTDVGPYERTDSIRLVAVDSCWLVSDLTGSGYRRRSLFSTPHCNVRNVHRIIPSKSSCCICSLILLSRIAQHRRIYLEARHKRSLCRGDKHEDYDGAPLWPVIYQ